MTLTHRLLSSLIFILFILGGIALMFFSAYLIPISVTLLGILILLLIRFFWHADIRFFEKLLFIVSITLFFLSSISFFIFLERPVLEYAVIICSAIIGAIYIENAYKFLWKSPDYHLSALSNVSSYMHLLSVFFATVALFNLRFFFGISNVTLVLIALVFSILLFYVYLWSQHVLLSSSRWFAVLFAIMFVELIYVLNIWPHLPLVKGVVTLAFVYGMMQILLSTIQDSVQTNKILRTLGIVTFVLFIVLVTAQWQ